VTVLEPAPISMGDVHSPIIELRRYTLHPVRRDDLISLFETHFLEGQETCGMTIVGQFRDADDPDAFVWLRGFSGMEARRQALTAFYDGPVWRAHRNAANATMIDSDDVLLLHPARAANGFTLPRDRGDLALGSLPHSIIETVTYRLQAPAEAGFLDFHEEVLAPLLRAAGNHIIATFASEHSPNTFTRLPIREGENVVVAFSRFDSLHAQSAFARALRDNPAWRAVLPRLETYVLAHPIVTRLSPTTRSLLR
jgi:hypothetical protein